MNNLLIWCMAIILSSNLLLFTFALFRKALVKLLDMQLWDFLFKLILIYMNTCLIAMTLFFFHMYTAPREGVLSGADIRHYRIIRYFTINELVTFHGQVYIKIVLSIWAAGTIITGIFFKIREFWFLKNINQNSTPCNGFWAEQAKIIMSKKNISFNIRIYTSALVPSPFVIGLHSPKLFIPSNNWTPEAANLILEHELTHCQKHDYLYRRMTAFLRLIFWFNPLIKTFIEFFIDINEMSCDEYVLQNRTNKERADYARLLIRVAENSSLPQYVLSLTGCSNQSFERRIRHIMTKKKRVSILTKILVISGTVMLCPISSFAASAGLAHSQDLFVRSYMERYYISEDVGHENVFQELCDEVTLENISIKSIEFLRGSNDIDVEVTKKETALLDTVDLCKGDTVNIYFSGDSSSDKFKAGLRNSSGPKQYVASSRGKISHMFTIKSNDTYDIFIENTLNTDIHITGNIYISH